MGIKERVQLAWSIESLVCEDIESLVERKEQAQKQITNLYHMTVTAVEQELIDSIRRSIILWEGRWYAIMQAINETAPKRYQVVCWIPHGGGKAELFDYANGMDRLNDLKEMMPENRYELQEINPMDALAIKHKDIHEASDHTIYVLDDGETWSGGGNEVHCTDEEYRRISEENEKVYNVIPNWAGQ